MIVRCQFILLLVLVTMVAGADAFELKDVNYRTDNAGTVIFSHNNHLKTKRIRNNCKACHKADNQKMPRATMAQMEKGGSCGACHNGKKAFPLTNCVGCHKIKEQKLRAGDLGPIIFSHKGHAAKQNCGSCHNQVFKTGKNKPVGMAAMKSGKSCGACHNAKAAFGLDKCIRCHQIKEPVYRIADAGDVRFSHKFHLDLYQCSDCHQKVFASGGSRKTATMDDMTKGKSCGACHDGKTAFTAQDTCDRCHIMK